MWDLSFSALNEDSGFWPRLQRRCYGGFRRLSGLSQRFWLSRAYFPFLLWVTLGFAALRQPVYGAMALLGDLYLVAGVLPGSAGVGDAVPAGISAVDPAI